MAQHPNHMGPHDPSSTHIPSGMVLVRRDDLRHAVAAARQQNLQGLWLVRLMDATGDVRPA